VVVEDIMAIAVNITLLRYNTVWSGVGVYWRYGGTCNSVSRAKVWRCMLPRCNRRQVPPDARNYLLVYRVSLPKRPIRVFLCCGVKWTVETSLSENGMCQALI